MLESNLISFVIPCYGSEKTIEGVIAEIEAVVSERTGYDYEIICVNDCSPDGVLDVIKRLAESNPKIIAIDLAKNMGKHAAIMAGCSLVRGEYGVNLDDDGQCPMDRLWDLIDALDGGADVAIAKYPRKKQSAFKNFGSNINAAMSRWLLGRPKGLQFENFSANKRFIIDEIVKCRSPFPYGEGLILRTTSNIVNVEMEERERADGRTGNYTFRKSLSLWLNGFTAFSVKPLRVASVFGTVIALAGFIYGLTIIIRKLTDASVALGYSSTMATLLFVGGVLMMMLGLVGEYIGRIYISINNSPQYVIRKIYRKD
jgi:undecaprenyl-phosphate 4-deoxy-4-formamido-L-arabinose transferase